MHLELRWESPQLNLGAFISSCLQILSKCEKPYFMSGLFPTISHDIFGEMYCNYPFLQLEFREIKKSTQCHKVSKCRSQCLHPSLILFRIFYEILI